MEHEQPQDPADRSSSPARSAEDHAMEGESPPPTPIAPRKRQLSAAQKEALAKAREKARQTKLAKTEARKKEQAEFQQWKNKPDSPLQEYPDPDSRSPSPAPVKKKTKSTRYNAKKKPVKRRRPSPSSESEYSSDPTPERTAEDHLKSVKAAYDHNITRYRNDVLYRSLFPYLG